MSVASIEFAAFVAAALLGYHPLPTRWQNRWLLLVSCAFYASFGWQLVVILLLVTAGNVLLATAIARFPRHRSGWLTGGIAANVSVLLALRVAPLAHAETPLFHPVTVVGAAFYALRAISYLVDVANGTAPRATFAELALYFAYFPALLAGPIERAGVFLPRLRAGRVVDGRAVAHGLGLVLLGMTRKLLIADPLADMLPERAFVTPRGFDGSTLAWAIVGYAFYLYNEFAGYTAIVRGVSALFGIPLPANFARPFFARSFSNFWNRWHVSLTHWLRDYVYLPTSRAMLRRWSGMWSVPNLVAPPMVTMLVCGAWHGSAPDVMPGMLLWGALHGLYLTLERLRWLRTPRRPGQPGAAGGGLVTRVAVFVLVVLALVPFRVGLPVTLSYWDALARWKTWDGSLWPMTIPCALSLALDWTQERRRHELVLVGSPRFACAVVGVAILLVCYVTTRGTGERPFVYQGF